MTQTRTDRHQKAQELWQQGKVFELVGFGDMHVVTNGAGEAYAVDGESCTCPDHEHRHVACKHIMAVEMARARGYVTADNLPVTAYIVSQVGQADQEGDRVELTAAGKAALDAKQLEQRLLKAIASIRKMLDSTYAILDAPMSDARRQTIQDRINTLNNVLRTLDDVLGVRA